MASVFSYDLWLNPEDDPGSGMGFRLPVGFKADPQVTGEIRQYGNSRLRYVTTGVTAQQWAGNVYCDTRTQVDALYSWAGTVVCVRDPFGRKFYGVYTDLSIPEVNPVDLNDIVPVLASFTVNQVTVSELAA